MTPLSRRAHISSVSFFILALFVSTLPFASPVAAQSGDGNGLDRYGKIAFVRSTVIGSGTAINDLYVINRNGSGYTNLTRSSAQEYSPAVSPDGTRLAFGALDSELVNGRYVASQAIYVMDANGANRRQLTRDPRLSLGGRTDHNPVWSPDGTRIAFVRYQLTYRFNGAQSGYAQLMVINADGSGEAILITGEFGGIGKLAWSPDGSRIAFAGGSRSSDIFLAKTDGSLVTRLTNERELFWTYKSAPTWSPDGTQIAYQQTTFNNSAGAQIFIINADGSNARQVTRNGGREPAWSPDGLQIAFVRSGDFGSDIFLITPDGTSEMNVTNSAAFEGSPAWSPDGSRIYFGGNRDDGQLLGESSGSQDIYLMNGDGSNPTRLTSGRSPSWSGDGLKLAFVRNDVLHTINVDGTGEKSLGVAGTDPSLSPDGSRIVYENGSTLYVINADGSGNPTRLLNSSGFDPAWSPDGTKIAYWGVIFGDGTSTSNDIAGIIIVNADGSNPRQAAFMIDGVSDPAWSPDGTKIAFRRQTSANNAGEIIVVPAQANDRREYGAIVTDRSPAFDTKPSWSPDGKQIVFESDRNLLTNGYSANKLLFIVPANGGTVLQLTEQTNVSLFQSRNDDEPAWQPPPSSPSLLPTRSRFAFSRSIYGVKENQLLTVTVARFGDVSRAAQVDVFTADETAFAGQDYAASSETLRFAAGQSVASFEVRALADSLSEASEEAFTLRLANPVGAQLTTGITSARVVLYDDPAATGNPIDDDEFFIRRHYADFLGRRPEPAGLASWLGVLASCGTDATCKVQKRIQVSSSFFRSQEFQQKGYYVYLYYVTSFGRKPYQTEFQQDTELITDELGSVVTLRKNIFAAEWTSRPAFAAEYNQLGNGAYVDRLLERAGVRLDARDQLVRDLDAGSKTRADVLRFVVDSAEVRARHFNHAFVTMQYFGYLRRDAEQSGFDAWLRVLERNPSDYQTMVKGFVNSIEYRSRFGRP